MNASKYNFPPNSGGLQNILGKIFVTEINSYQPSKMAKSLKEMKYRSEGKNYYLMISTKPISQSPIRDLGIIAIFDQEFVFHKTDCMWKVPYSSVKELDISNNASIAGALIEKEKYVKVSFESEFGTQTYYFACPLLAGKVPLTTNLDSNWTELLYKDLKSKVTTIDS